MIRMPDFENHLLKKCTHCSQIKIVITNQIVTTKFFHECVNDCTLSGEQVRQDIY